ncbi:hypothetical protein QVD17_11922 [Tagetes erecta]|uniref:Uncharacterized protein n=1 Tax=Tagetes erecta TaxID=13708 RepID=A0AAD8NVE3_TARER|nr:hypothetical protein QVD17_11922 [Tagetes erecta]
MFEDCSCFVLKYLAFTRFFLLVLIKEDHDLGGKVLQCGVPLRRNTGWGWGRLPDESNTQVIKIQLNNSLIRV